MFKEPAIKFSEVSQSYPLFTSPKEILIEFLGINKFLKKEQKIPTFEALQRINLTIYKGDRIGIIGQNGAGKTTLLKLATGNYLPTSGTVEIHGKVQSLMDSGLGFHEEFTGRENIKSSLLYNGLTPKQMKLAIDDIIDFAELGDFVDQPIKTYSLGMISRLGFATATAIHPEILIIDEIMGAGDAYFAAKSAQRMQNLTKEGTTLLLVSHSTAQIIQFCNQAIWMKDKNIYMQGEALEICKAYSKYMRELDELRLEKQNQSFRMALKEEKLNNSDDKILQEEEKLNNSDDKILQEEEKLNNSDDKILQEEEKLNNSDDKILQEENNCFIENRSISRWNGSGEILIKNFYMLNAQKEKKFTFCSGEQVEFFMEIEAQNEGEFPCYYVIATYTLLGQPATIHSYEKKETFIRNQKKIISMKYDNLLLGNGDYVVSLAVYKSLNLDDTSTALFYDLLDRSFQFKVLNKYKQDMTTFIHPAVWIIE